VLQARGIGTVGLGDGPKVTRTDNDTVGLYDGLKDGPTEGLADGEVE